MSHSYGAVKFSDDTIYYFEYNGTTDVCLPKLYKTIEEVSDNWRKGKWENCTCNKKPEDIIIFSSYGRGFYWPGKACRDCMVITDGHTTDYNTEQDGIPDWYPYKKELES